MKIYHRASGTYVEESEYQQGLLQFLYETIPGRMLLKLAVSPTFSKWRARYQHSARSKKDILPFATQYGIDLTGYDVSAFVSFNDFFTRKRNCSTDTSETDLIAVADSRLSVYPISEDLTLRIKHSLYSLQELAGNRVDLKSFSGGTCLVFRLAVQDYHRYVFPDSGVIIDSGEIPGVLHTVRPVSERYCVYSRNYRIWTAMETEHFGSLLQIEVGALLVGKICNHSVLRFTRMQEKGYFEFGGSTILLIIPEEIQIEEDILSQSQRGIETKVTIGEKIGTIKRGKNHHAETT